MPLVYAVLIIAIIALYLAFLTIVIPLAALAAFVAYSVGLPLAYLIAMVQVLGIRSPNLPRSPRWPKPPGPKTALWPHSPRDGEPAELGYFHGPATADIDLVVRVSIGHANEEWTVGGGLIVGAFDTEDAMPFTVPMGIGGAVGLLAGTVAGMAGFLVLGLIHLAVAGVSFGAARLAGLMVRGLDSALLRLKNIRMVCPSCYERVPYPAYRCANEKCTFVHADIRPGRYGIFRRRCWCGTRLPTLLMFGSARMDALCPHHGCGKAMEHRPGEARELVLPLVGAAGAGKTRLLNGMAALLLRREDAEPADSATARDLQSVEELLAPGRATPKTGMALPQAKVIRLTTGKSPCIVHLFDAAGERFYRNETTQELRFLDKARTFILVIDPLSVDAYWDRLPGDRRAELTPTRSQSPSPELAYQQTHPEMERMGVRLRRARLAVVFSRADLIGDLDGAKPVGRDVEKWAREQLGLGNLIRSIRHNFGKVEFFRTAAIVDGSGRIDESIAVLTRWLLAPEGVDVPDGSPGRAR